MAPALAALLLLAPAAAAAAAGLGAVERGLVRDAQPAAWAKECLGYWQATDSLPSPDPADYDPTALFAKFSNYDLIAAPSGLCTDTLPCAFTNCKVSPAFLIGGAYPALAAFDVASATNEDVAALAAAHNLTLNLPDQVALPTSVQDIVDVVEHAKAAGMPVSVKTSGHSYPGSSTLAGSVNVNLRDFPKVSQVPWMQSLLAGDLPAVTPCDAEFLASRGLEMPQACRLALARGNPAVLRVGGGEVWDDAYRAVDNANYWLQGAVNQTVEVMGGGAGTVSAAGGWMQGGGLGWGQERIYGFGADQVLELEMVLASGQHVKLGPSKWEAAEGFLYPKTTAVEGFCNANVDAPEREWRWEACEEAVPFEDLWYAVRGGGGGTYGIVTALTYQLHPRRTIDQMTLTGKSAYTDACPIEFFTGGYPEYYVATMAEAVDLTAAEKAAYSASNSTSPAGCREVSNAFSDFLIDVLYDPAAVGISEEASLNCGHSGMSFYLPIFGELYCHNGGGEELMQAWTAYWQNYTSAGRPVPEAMQAEWDAWVDGSLAWAVAHYRSYASSNIARFAPYDAAVPEGHVPDSPSPMAQGFDSAWSAVVPTEFFLQKNDDVHNLLRESGVGFHVAGGRVGIAQDQMSPISEIQRLSGGNTIIVNTAEYWLPKIQAFYPAPPSDDVILGGSEFNHIGSDAFGPLKGDHSAYCPGNLTHAEREAQCVSVQEFTWGTEGLRRLEAIKEKVDPTGMFRCQKCVGFRADAAEPQSL